MTIKPTFGFVLEYVPDVEDARRFYSDILGLKVERAHPVFVQFQNFAVASDQSLTGTRAPEIYWLVDDIETAFAEISQKAEVVFPIRQMPFGKVFCIKDPAGNAQFLLQFSQERPSSPVP